MCASCMPLLRFTQVIVPCDITLCSFGSLACQTPFHQQPIMQPIAVVIQDHVGFIMLLETLPDMCVAFANNPARASHKVEHSVLPLFMPYLK